MSPDERAACLAALDAAERAAEALRHVLAAEDNPAADLVPLATAAAAWGTTKEAARKRAQRGDGCKRGGRWYVSRAAITA